MRVNKKYFWVIVFFCSSLFLGCTKGLEPIPAATTLTMSWSLPVGTDTITFDKAFKTFGDSILNLGEDLPSWAHYTYVSFRDTVPLNLSEISKHDTNIEVLEFKLNLWNQFPVSGMAQIFFLNQNSEPEDMLFSQGYITIDSALTSNGKVIKQVYKSYTIYFDRSKTEDIDKIERIKTYDRIVIDARICPNEDIDSDNVQYFSNYKLKIQIGIRVDFKVEI